MSDAPGNTSQQTRTADETARVWIASFDIEGQTFRDWVFSNWNWIEGPLVPVRVQESDALRAQFSAPDSPQYQQIIVWVDRHNSVLVIWAQVKIDKTVSLQTAQKIITSVALAR
jgi:hypothetical protein